MLSKFANKIRELHFVENVELEDEELTVMFSSNPTTYSKQLSEVRNEYPKVVKTNEYNTENEYIQIYST